MYNHISRLVIILFLNHHIRTLKHCCWGDHIALHVVSDFWAEHQATLYQRAPRDVVLARSQVHFIFEFFIINEVDLDVSFGVKLAIFYGLLLD